MVLLCVMVFLTLEYCILNRIRFEKVITAITGIAILVCYVLAMFQRMQWFQWIVYTSFVVMTGNLIYRLITHRTKCSLHLFFENAVTPGFVAFIAVLVLYAFTMGTHVVNATDDFNYWAIEVKSLYAHNGFVDAYHHLSPRFMSYTPGVQLFQWIGVQMAGEFSDGTLYISLALFNSIFLLPLGGGLTWKKAYYLPVFLIFMVAAPTLLFRDTYVMLRVDATLGVCLGCALCQAWSLAREEKPSLFDAVNLGLTLSSLALVKQIGIGWALLPLSLLFIFRNRKSRIMVRSFIPLAIFAAVTMSWFVFTQINQLNGIHDILLTSTISDMAQSNWEMPQNLQLLPSALWGALTFADRATLVNSTSTSLAYLPMAGWGVLLVAVPMLLSMLRKDQETRFYRRVSLWLLGCTLLLLLAFTAIFLTAFASEFDSFINDAYPRLQYLLERYLGAFLLGGVLLDVYLVMRSKAPEASKVSAAVIALALLVNWGQLSFNLWPGEYVPTEPTDIYIYQEENFWVSDVENLEDPLNAIILYGVDPTPLRPERLQYAVAPVKIVTFYGGIDSYWFIQLLKNRHITHVICMDDNNPTYQTALEFTEDGYMDTYTLYAVTWEGDRPILTST